jgi:hypothetical protein
MTDGYPKTINMANVSDNSSHTSPLKRHGQAQSQIQGVKILGFGTKSLAKEAGFKHGDIIIEYDGTRYLTTEKLLPLTATTKPEGIQVRVVFVRKGIEYSLSMPPGPLGISAMDIMRQYASASSARVNHVREEKHDPIPVLQIICEAITIPWHKRATMFWALIPISVVLIAINTIITLMQEELRGVPALISLLLLLPAGAVFAVTCHRLVLLGNESVPKYGFTSWSQRETRFVGWTIFCAVIGGIIGGIISVPIVIFVIIIGLIILPQIPADPWVAIGGAAILVAIIPVSYVWARLSVLLPATAVDERPNFGWAWGFTRGNGWRLFLVLSVFPAVLGLGPALLHGHSVIVDLLFHSLGCVLGVIEIAALSLSYRHLTGRSTYHADDPSRMPIEAN